jgi:hypothetical protein
MIAAKSLRQLRENIATTAGNVAEARQLRFKATAVMNQMMQRLSNDAKDGHAIIPLG